MDTETERRSSPRNRCLLGARAVLNGGASTVSCVMRNHSETGALLSFAQPEALPSRFDLIIDKHDASVIVGGVWRQGVRMGVTFAADGAMATLDRLAGERETARLRRNRAADVRAAEGY
jgi:hypothetical protein